jgi:hypothetical protein
MTPKIVIKFSLLVFVFVSLGFLMTKEASRDTSSANGAGDSQSGEGPNVGSVPADRAVSGKAAPRVVTYYFHTTFRCVSCRKIEAYSREAIERGFPHELREGKLEWKVINVEEDGNSHFIDDYRLFTKSLILVRMKDGKQAEWKNLRKVWELLNNKEAFLRYVQEEVRTYLEAV